MVLAGMACMVHAALPFLFVRTGSRAIEELNARILATRRAAPPPVIGGEHLPL
jgi:hypothetical protein